MDNGLTWADEQCASLPGGYDVRDPFVFDDPGGSGRYALLAKPCRWEDWQRSARSAIEVWRLVADTWEPCGDVHLAFSPGVVAEMPRLLWLGGRCFLVVSTVDRRDANRSSVMIYPGRFTDGTFYPSDENGRLLDAGPDYYAAISGNGRLANMIVAWAGS